MNYTLKCNEVQFFFNTKINAIGLCLETFKDIQILIKLSI